MAKPKTDLGQRCPAPPYTRWDQRGKPVLLCYLKKLSGGKSLCLSLETQHPEIAKRHMRLLVAWELGKGRLSPGSGAAKVYGPKGTGRSRLEKLDAEVRQLKRVSEAKYGSEALTTAKRWSLPVGIIHHLAGRKPKTAAGTFRTRRMRARKHGHRVPKGDTWEHRAQGGKYVGWNGKVLTARLQIDRQHWQWPLKVSDEEEAEALMGPVCVAREHLHQAAVEELNCKLGTIAAADAAVALAGARVQLARAISRAGGPEKLAEFVKKGPREGVGTAVSQPSVISRAERRAIKLTAQENCVQAYMNLIEASPDGPPEPREVLARKMMNDFRVTWHEARDCRGEAIKRTGNLSWSRHGRRRR